jgi:hypothetical protein
MAVVVAVLVCMLLMPGMAIFALAGAAGAILLLPRLVRQIVRSVSFPEPGGHPVLPTSLGRAGPGPPLLPPLRL